MTEHYFLEPSNKFIVEVPVSLQHHQLLQLFRYLNLHYLGDVNAYDFVDGEMVPLYPEKETEEFKNATYNAHPSYTVTLSVEFDVNGKPTFEIVNLEE